MQQLGYFDRPIASTIYLILITFAFSFFILNLWLFRKNKVGLRYLKVASITNTLILIVAYPLLSSDLFNYMFDAKIILNYHANPYTHRPLDFPNDEWIRFMRWVHRYSPYGPLWLGMSLVPALLGFGKFILNFLTFKIFIGVFHLINTYLIYKILRKTNHKSSVFWTATYAFNPLFLIEGVVNAHNDVVFATFILVTGYFLVINKKIFSLYALIGGLLIKYLTILNLPWLLLEFFSKKQNIKRFIFLNLLTLVLFTYIFSSFKITVPFVSSGATQVQFQPWYLFWTLPFISLLASTNLLIVAIFLSVGSQLRYLPFLYFGDWSYPATNNFMQLVTVAPLLISALFVLIIRAIKSAK